jgi:hypothetical protein
VHGSGEAATRVDVEIRVKRHRGQTVGASNPRQEKFAAPGSLVQTTKVEPERRVPEFPMIFQGQAEISARPPRARIVTPCAQFAPRLTYCGNGIFRPNKRFDGDSNPRTCADSYHLSHPPVVGNFTPARLLSQIP